MLIANIQKLIGIHPVEKQVLRGAEMSVLPVLENAWLLTENGLIKDFGSMDSMPFAAADFPGSIDASGKLVLPCWCDSHTHIVFAASREAEFVMKITGKSYEEIAAAGGGILNSARQLQQATEDDLYASASLRLKDMIMAGTGAVEIKSGYGLNTESELKMLRVIKRLKKSFPIPIKATFLGAHTYPEEFKNNHQGYLDLIIKEMLPAIEAEGLADYIDVFCEKGFFSVDETSSLLAAGIKYGLKPKIHANQLSVSGAAETGIKHNAVSVDHLEETTMHTIASLAGSDTIATLLPGCSLFLGIPFAEGRKMIDQGAVVALASDFNPGSAPSGNMNLVVALGCLKLKLLPEESINAATLNGAAAMEISGEAGSIAIGKRANFFITKEIPSVVCIPYSFGQSQVETVIINGEIYNG